MDGLLLDSERLAMQSFCDACEGQGVTPDLDIYRRCIGTTHQRTREILIQSHGPDFPYEAVAREWSQRYESHVLHQPVPVKDGAVELLEYLAHRQIPTAVATQTLSHIAERKLELAGLAVHFQHLVGGDQVRHGKPHPEPYLEAAHRLQVNAADCWALEDSNNGVRSAHTAGMFVIHIPDLLPPSAETLDLRLQQLNSLHEVIALLDLVQMP